MQRELADFIIQACENCDTFFEDEESMPTIRENYSGRGMYGRETTAIVCSDLMAVMAAVVDSAFELDYETIDPKVNLDDIRYLQTDSMGRSSIVIY